VYGECLDVYRADKKGECWWGLYVGATEGCALLTGNLKTISHRFPLHLLELTTQFSFMLLRYCIFLPLVGIAFRFNCNLILTTTFVPLLVVLE
jgi:hypothetical protein